MGWNGTQIFPHEVEATIKDEIKSELDDDETEIVSLVEDESKEFWSVAYGKPGNVKGAIVHVEWIEDEDGGSDWFMVKIITEDEGPMEMAAPLSVIDQLSPTENKWALEWRRHCRNFASGVAEVIHPYTQ